MEGIDPGLPALVMNLAVGTEHGQCVIESLIGRARGGTAGGLRGGVEPVKRSQLLVKSIAGVDVHPLKRASGKALLQALRTAKHEQVARRQSGQHPLKVDEKLRDAKHEDCGFSVQTQVGGRRDKLRGDKVQVADQLAGDVTSVADRGINNGAWVFHDRKLESGMGLGFLLHQNGGGAEDVHIEAKPVDDRAVDAAADHVLYLAVDLSRIVGTIAHIYVVRPAKPGEEARKHLGVGTRVEQCLHPHFPPVPCPYVPVTLRYSPA